MPYLGRMDLEFPQDEQRNVMIVLGDNMRGKTSIMNAIRWAFYNEALGRRLQPIPTQELVNKEASRIDDWRIEVHVKFDANEHTYDLRRVADRKMSVGRPSKPEHFTGEVYLSRDGDIVRGDQVDFEIARIAPKQISRFFLFDGELLQEYETLLIEGSQQGQKIKAKIEQVLGLPSLVKGRDDIKIILKKAQRRQARDIQQVEGLEREAQVQAGLLERRDAIDRDLEDLRGRLAKTCHSREALADEIEESQELSSAAAVLKAKRDEREFLRDQRKKEEDERRNVISEAWRDLFDVQIEIRRKQLNDRRILLLKSSKQRGDLEARASDLGELLKTHQCPTCNQPVDMAGRKIVAKELGKIQGILESRDDRGTEANDISEQLSALSKIRSINARDRIFDAEKIVQQYEVRLTRLDGEIDTLNEDLADFDSVEIARKRGQHDTMKEEEGRLGNEIESVEDKRRSLVNELAMSQAKIEGQTRERAQKSTIKVSICGNLEKVFSQSIDDLREGLRERVGRRANEAFKRMTTQSGYQGLKINENYGLQIIDASGDPVVTRSAGAEQVVALSLIDGLNRTGRSAGPVIMDTPFGRLDLGHRGNILGYFPSVTSQLILLVHSGELQMDRDLDAISERIGLAYRIVEVSSTHSRIERIIE